MNTRIGKVLSYVVALAELRHPKTDILLFSMKCTKLKIMIFWCIISGPSGQPIYIWKSCISNYKPKNCQNITALLNTVSKLNT